MKMERMRNEMELFSKVDGRMYKVTAFDGQKAEAAEMLEDGTLGNKMVTVSEKNSLAFRIMADPAPYPVPSGYHVSDGILMKNGSPVCEQGQIYVNSIIDRQPDILILSVRTKDKNEDRIDLFAYEESRDRFSKLRASLPKKLYSNIPCSSEEGDVAVGYTDIAEETVKDGNGAEKKVRMLQNAEVFVVRNGKMCAWFNAEHPIEIADATVFTNPSTNTMHLLAPSDEEAGADGAIKPRERRCWMLINSMHQTKTLMMEDKQVKAAWSPAYKCFVLKGDKTIYVSCTDSYIYSSKVKELAGYDILIDVTREEYTTRYTFCNEAYEMKTLVYKTTRDRGAIITIE